MRIGGIASGMDTEQMVRDLMRAERMRLDRFFQQEQRLQWKQEAFSSINRNMARFILDTRQSFGITSVSDNGYFRTSSVNGFDWVKRATSSNESAVRASATSNTMQGTHRVEVKHLAEVASVTSEKLTGTDPNAVLDENLRFKESGSFTVKTASGEKEIEIGDVEVLGEAIADFDFSGENNLTFSLNGIPIVLDDDYGNMENLVNEINSQLDGKGNVTVEADGDKLKFTSDTSIHIGGSGQGNLSAIGLEETSEVAIRSINDVVRELNNDTSLGIRAAFDANMGKLMITSRNTGEEEFIQIVDAGEGLELAHKMFGGADAAIFQEAHDVDGKPRYDAEGKAIGIVGKNAEILFNGNEVSNANNNFSVFGVNLQLQSITGPEEVITINVGADTDSIYDKIKDFVDQYNALLDEINGQLGQKYHRDFPPLTNEQKEAMSEKDIEKWEEKSKSGLLRNDPTLTRTLQTVRTDLYKDVNASGSYTHMTQIGITTGSYQDGGKLVIDEEKLRNAINEDPEGVIDLMFKIPDSNLQGDARTKDTGLVQRVYNGLMTGMEEIVRQSGPGEDSNLLTTVKGRMLREFRTTHSSISVMDRDLSNINRRIAREEDILIRREDRYWQQFSAMEKAMAEMQQQSMWLMSQMGQGFY